MNIIVTVFLTFLHFIYVKGQNTVTLKPTVCPYSPFSAEEDANNIHKILKDTVSYMTIGHPKKLSYIFSQRSLTQRLEIVKFYNNKFQDKTMISDIRDKLTGECESMHRRMMLSQEEVRYYDLVNAFNDEPGNVNLDDVVDILCTLTKLQYIALNRIFNDLEKKTLYSYVRGQESRRNWRKDTRTKILGFCMMRFRDQPEWNNNPWCADNLNDTITTFNNDKIIKEDFEKRLGFVLGNCTNEQIRYIAEKTNLLQKVHDIIDDHHSDYRFVAETLIQSSTNMTEYLADTFHKSMLTFGAKHSIIIRRAVLHCDRDLGNVQDVYMAKFNGKKLLNQMVQEVLPITEAVDEFPRKFYDFAAISDPTGKNCYRALIIRVFKDAPLPPCTAETDPLTPIINPDTDGFSKG